MTEPEIANFKGQIIFLKRDRQTLGRKGLRSNSASPLFQLFIDVPCYIMIMDRKQLTIIDIDKILLQRSKEQNFIIVSCDTAFL